MDQIGLFISLICTDTRRNPTDDAWYRSRRLKKTIWYLLVAAAHDCVEVVRAVDEEACLVLELLLLFMRLPRATQLSSNAGTPEQVQLNEGLFFRKREACIWPWPSHACHVCPRAEGRYHVLSCACI